MKSARRRLGVEVARAARWLALAGVALLSACGPTEVVVVVDTDAPLMSPEDEIDIAVTADEFGGFPTSTAPLAQLPVTLGVTTKSHESKFSVLVTLVRAPDRTAVITRNALDIAFSNDDQRAVFVPLFNKCACVGHQCPNPVDPDCLDLAAPPTTSFDEDSLPRLPKTAPP